MKRAQGVVTGVLLMTVSGSPAETAYYVSPQGSDAWSGRLPAPNQARNDGPFASPGRAQTAVREAKAGGASGPFAVELRAGTYPLNGPLVFTPADSGTPQAPVVWRAYGDERPVISGGRVLDGWRESIKDGTRRWTVAIPEVESGTWNFRQLFISTRGGPYQRRYRPHLGMLAVDHLTYSPRRKAAPHRAAQKDFAFFPGDLKQWENLSDVELVALHMWSSSRLFIDHVDPTHNVVEFTGLPTFAIGQVGPHNPYYVENVKEALSKPGEWYLDRPTGTLTYVPKDGETLGECRLVAPFLTRVLALQGDLAQGRVVSDLRFSRLTFAHNESRLPPEGYGGSQAQPDLPAAIEAVGARDCVFERCTIAHTGNYGIGLGQGCQSNRIVGCRLYDLGGGGIKIGDITMPAGATAPVLPTGNVVENCALSDGGLMYFSANAIWAGIVRDTVIRHNEIWNFPYSGIAVGWSWNDRPTSCANNQIEYNRIHHVVALLADGASIYTLGRQPGTVIRGNVLHDNIKSPHARQYWQLGLYLDEGSSEMLVENNLDYRVGTHGFNMNGGAENRIQNNIFGPVYGNQAPYVRCYARPFTKANVFTHNLCYCDSDNLADAVWDPAQFDCRENLYWNTAGKPLLFKSKSFAEWQATGQDQGSLNQDPLFEDPAAGDFRLKPGSPAIALGFVPFDPGAAGLTAEFKDVATPVTVTPSPVYAMEPAVIPPDRPGFAIDCEDVPVGVVPRELVARTADGHGTDAQVTEATAHGGARCLQLTDRQGEAKTFLPYLTHYLTPPVTAGTVTFECAVKQPAAAPCGVSFEFRDYQPTDAKKQFVGGPAVFLRADGRLETGGKSLGTVPPDAWAVVRIVFTMGQAAASEVVVTATVAGGQQQVRVPLGADFHTVSQLLLVCGDDRDGAVYLDDLALRVEP